MSGYEDNIIDPSESSDVKTDTLDEMPTVQLHQPEVPTRSMPTQPQDLDYSNTVNVSQSLQFLALRDYDISSNYQSQYQSWPRSNLERRRNIGLETNLENRTSDVGIRILPRLSTSDSASTHSDQVMLHRVQSRQGSVDQINARQDDVSEDESEHRCSTAQLRNACCLLFIVLLFALLCFVGGWAFQYYRGLTPRLVSVDEVEVPPSDPPEPIYIRSRIPRP